MGRSNALRLQLWQVYDAHLNLLCRRVAGLPIPWANYKSLSPPELFMSRTKQA